MSTGSFSRVLFFGWMASLVLCIHCSAASSRVEIPASTTDLPAGPVWVTLKTDAKLPAGAVKAVDAASGKSVPAQADENGRLCLWSEARKAGQVWAVAVEGPDAAAKNRVVIDTGKPDVATITLDGKEFTAYNYSEKLVRPYLYPLIGPTGDAFTRHYPMREDVADEAKDRDHPHHTSLWTAHGDINGVDHWSVKRGDKLGIQKHRKFLSAQSGPVFGRLQMLIDWNDAKGTRQLTEQRTYTFYAPTDDRRLIDVQVLFEMTDGDVKFGDTKEGGLVALRTPVSMTEKNGGTIRNAEGATGMKGCWGKPSAWCDYFGKVNDKIVGMSIFDCPGNFRYPTPYHVRNYGLFTANPFGLSEFKKPEKADGSQTWKKGEKVTFNYRVLLHKGDTDAAKVAEQYELYKSDAAGMK